MNKRIIALIAAGGTAGHINPAHMLANELNNRSYEVIFITDQRGFKVLRDKKDYQVKKIFVTGIAGKKVYQQIISLVSVCISTVIVLTYLLKFKPNIIIGFGSYVQVPSLLAARILKIPTLLHEANAVIGRSNKIFWNKATIRAIAFKKMENKDAGTICVGMPIRTGIEEIYDKKYNPPNRNNIINILITGGSLGADSLSSKIPKVICNLPKMIKDRLSVVHQVKEEYMVSTSSLYRKNNINVELKVFIKDMEQQLSKAHLVISRAGASTVAENSLSKRPSIYIPLPGSIDKHQQANAREAVEVGAAWVVNDNEIASENFIQLLNNILSNGDLLKKASNKAKLLAIPNATKKLGDLVSGIAA